MASDISVKIGVDGEKEFRSALAGINSQLKNLDSEMRATVSSLSGMDSAENAAAKQSDILARSIEVTKQKISVVQSEYDRAKTKLDDLANALQRAKDEFGDNSSQASKAQNAYNRQAKAVNDLGTKLNNATADMNRMEKEMRDISSGAADAGDALDDLGDEAQDAGSSFSSAFVGGAIAGGITSLIGKLTDLSDSTQEYRRIIASLENSSQSAGYTAEQTAASYQQLYGVLADEQTTATTVANLQALGLSQEQLANITDATIGAWARYGDSIPIDGLAESINETVRSGQVTGVFADVLNWGADAGEKFGVALKENIEVNEEWNESVEDAETAEDYFNLALQEAKTPAERLNTVMKALSKQGLSESGKAWRENNADLVESNQKTAEITSQMAKLAEQVTPAANSLKDLAANGLGMLSSAIEFAKNNMTGLITVLSGAGAVVGGVKIASLATDLVGVVNAAKAGSAALAAYQTATNGAAIAQGALSAAMALTPAGALALGITGVVTALAVYANQAELSKTETDELIEQTDELNAKYQEQQAELEAVAERRDAQLEGSMAEINHVQSMVNELGLLVDANGRVKTGEEERAAVLASLINDVYPNSVKLTQDQKGAYIETADALDLLLEKEQLKAWLEANGESYQTAIANQQNYIQGITDTSAKIEELSQHLIDLQTQQENARNEGNIEQLDLLQMQIDETNTALQEAQNTLNGYEQDYVDSVSTITQYENIKAASISNDEDQIRSALQETELNLKQYTGNNLAELQKQAADAEANYQTQIEMSKKYPKTVTENQLNEAKSRAEQAKVIAEQAGKEEMQANAAGIASEIMTVTNAVQSVTNTALTNLDKSQQAETSGGNFTRGFAKGMIGDALNSVVTAAQTVAQKALSSVNKAQDSHSPARKAMKPGKWFTQGYMIGILGAAPALNTNVRGMVMDLISTTTDTAETHIEKSNQIIQSAITSELDRLNKKVSDMEEKAADEQAAKELAQYQENIKKKYDELEKAETSKKQDILDQIAELEDSWNEKQLQKQQEAEKDKLEAQIDTLEQFQKEYESAMEAIQKSQESMAEKLANFGDLFETVKTETSEYLQLGDLQDEIDAINAYGDALESLKARGVSDTLMDEIISMSVEDATAYTEKLLSMTDDQYAEYMALWEEKQAKAQEIAKKFYSDEMEALQDEFVDKIPEELSGVKDEMRSIGVDGIQGMVNGMYSQSGFLYSAAASIVSQAIAAMRAAADINSPSKMTEKLVGAPMGQGVAVGFLDAMKKSRATIDNAIMAPFSGITSDDLYNAAAATVNGIGVQASGATGAQTIIIPVNLNGKQIAEVVFDPLKNVAKQRGVALG